MFFRSSSFQLTPRLGWNFASRISVIVAAIALGTSNRFPSCVVSAFQCCGKRIRGGEDSSRYSRRMMSTVSSTEIATQIRQSYLDSETDGVLKFVLSSAVMTNEKLDVRQALVPSILEAMKGEKKGSIASVMNAMIGSCCLLATNGSAEVDRALISNRVEDLLSAYQDLERDVGIAPDIVSYSLAYTALEDDAAYRDLALESLETALQQSKKLAGGKRRKILASMRRKQTSTLRESESNLQILLGDTFGVLLENEEFAVVNKPSGVSCFHRKTTTAGKVKKRKQTGHSDVDSSSDLSLEDALVNCNVVLSTLNPDALGLVHRLDRGSSGCLLMAKTNEMHARLMAEFFLRRTTKSYVALLQESESSRLEEKGTIERLVHGRPAKSQYRVVERNSSSGVSLVEFDIFTGRKHQIRVHAAAGLCSPVLNDQTYGSIGESNRRKKKGEEMSSREQFYLHARNLAIPRFGIDVESPTPISWQDEVAKVKNEQ